MIMGRAEIRIYSGNLTVSINSIIMSADLVVVIRQIMVGRCVLRIRFNCLFVGTDGVCRLVKPSVTISQSKPCPGIIGVLLGGPFVKMEGFILFSAD